MTWIQVLTIIAANLGLMITLFLWLRKEANADRKELSSAIITFKDLMFKETKDFHGRLCVIEERSKNNG